MIKKIALRDAFGKALSNKGEKNQKLVAISVDLKGACKLDYFFNKFPSRSFEIGIAEANSIGIATGLSFEGYRPFIASFGSFITGKHSEIRNTISYNNASVVIVGTHCGLIGSDGATQSALQDIAIMTSMPFFEVFQPCSPLDTKEIINYATKSKKPTYIRVPRNEIEEIFGKKHKFKIGVPNEIIKGSNTLIISSGAMVSNCFKAIKKINDNKIGLVNISSIKPLDHKKVINIINKYKKIIVVEDHYKIGGIGSIISEILSLHNIKKKFKIHALNNGFIDSDTPINLEKYYKMDINSLKKLISSF